VQYAIGGEKIMGNYIEFSATPIEPAEENYEIITAFLSEFAFDVFEFTDGKFRAFCEEEKANVSAAEVEDIIAPFIIGKVETQIIAKQNWNALWEKNFFDPLTIRNKVHIRAAFHPPAENVEYEIVIQPKMSFGTGHHATTQMMVSLMLDFETAFYSAFVMDMGAGTGILAILAEYLGASNINAVEIEDWSALNITENAEINRCSKISAFHDDAKFFSKNPNKKYNVVLANIHKQVLLNDTVEYAKSLQSGGLLFISGFFPSDLDELSNNCTENGLALLKTENLGQWCAAVFRKI